MSHKPLPDLNASSSLVAAMGADRAIEFLDSVLASVPSVVVRVDSGLRVRYLNRTPDPIPLESVLGEDVLSFIADGHRERARECFERAQSSGVVEHLEVLAGTDLHMARYALHVSPLREADGSVGLCISALDVTEQRAREQALEASRERLKVLAEATAMGQWEWDLTSGALSWDARMLEILGRPAPPTLDEFIRDCVHPDDREVVASRGKRAFEEGKLSSAVVRIVRPDGEVRWVMSSGALYYGEDGRPLRIVGGTVDVTQQRSTEEQLQRAQKMHALGTLTAGVAHNFNNMLMVVLPSLDVLERYVPAERRAILGNAQQATARAAEMIRQLMAFTGQRSTAQHREHPISEIVAQSVRMARQTLGGAIRLRTHEEAVPPVLCDDGAIQQVLVNMLVNARDALSDADVAEPVIDVYVDEATRTCDAHGKPERARFVRVRIRDNGCGMSEEVREQIFEPFFTTKESAGTGLGLSTSYAIVREHGGWIECESSPGKGTELQVWLPAHGDALGLSRPPGSASHRPRVLLVDDDQGICEVVVSILAPTYEVVAVPSVRQAEELLARERDFELCLLDQSMPGGPGRGLLGALRERLPSAKVLYFTGSAVERPEEVDGVIRKPVGAAELAAAVAEALG